MMHNVYRQPGDRERESMPVSVCVHERGEMGQDARNIHGYTKVCNATVLVVQVLHDSKEGDEHLLKRKRTTTDDQSNKTMTCHTGHSRKEDLMPGKECKKTKKKKERGVLAHRKEGARDPQPCGVCRGRGSMHEEEFMDLTTLKRKESG